LLLLPVAAIPRHVVTKRPLNCYARGGGGLVDPRRVDRSVVEVFVMGGRE
jgi:hypothetical protein